MPETFSIPTPASRCSTLTHSGTPGGRAGKRSSRVKQKLGGTFNLLCWHWNTYIILMVNLYTLKILNTAKPSSQVHYWKKTPVLACWLMGFLLSPSAYRQMFTVSVSQKREAHSLQRLCWSVTRQDGLSEADHCDAFPSWPSLLLCWPPATCDHWVREMWLVWMEVHYTWKHTPRWRLDMKWKIKYL